jgi:hypothetical protein
MFAYIHTLFWSLGDWKVLSFYLTLLVPKYLNSNFRPHPGLRLAQPGGPAARVCPSFLPEDGKKIQLPKCSNFIKI